MKTIIAGGRDCIDITILYQAIEKCGWTPSIIVSGCARGADSLGEMFAEENNIPICKFSADWNKHGKVAGFIRNSQMAYNADALIALWDGQSRGTKHMINEAKKRGLKIYIHYYKIKS